MEDTQVAYTYVCIRTCKRFCSLTKPSPQNGTGSSGGREKDAGRRSTQDGRPGAEPVSDHHQEHGLQGGAHGNGVPEEQSVSKLCASTTVFVCFSSLNAQCVVCMGHNVGS